MPTDADKYAGFFALSRFGYGPTPQDYATYPKMGYNGWLEEQLAPPNGDDSDMASRLESAKLHIKFNSVADKYSGVDEMRTLDTLDKPIEDVWVFFDGNKHDGAERRRCYDEVVAATYLRAIYSKYQLRESVVQFWHDHFHVNAPSAEQIMVALPTYDRDVIRKHALGNFRDMLEAVATSTAMLYYLSNRSSRAGAANENYARELFELHTLGRDAYLNDRYDRWREVPGAANGQPSGYIDQDVYEAARAFTGWTVEDNTALDGQRKLPATGKFTYVEAWHDGYQKRVLAQEFDPFAAAMMDGRKVLDLVAAHPETARHMAKKLCQRFIGPQTSGAFVDQVAAEWQKQAKASDQIARVIKFIAMSPEFGNSHGTKVKRPLALAASFARITAIDFIPTENFNNNIANAGQKLFGYPAPTGLPDDNAYFLGTSAMRNRWNLLLGIAQNSWETGICDPSKVVPQGGSDAATAGMYAKRWLDIFGVPNNDAIIASITGAIGLPPTVMLGSLDSKRLATIVAISAMAPNIQMS